MFCDSSVICETARHREAFERYNEAFVEQVRSYKGKSFVLGYSILGHCGRERTKQPIVFKISKDFLAMARRPAMKPSGKEITNAHFNFKKTPMFDHGLDVIILIYIVGLANFC